MPKKKYNDDELKRRALDLRRKGYSYREISRELGCSVYKVHELISLYESPNSRLKQVAELANKIDEISNKVLKLKSTLSNVKLLEGLNKEISKLKEDFEGIKTEISTKLDKMSKQIASLTDDIDWIRRSAMRRLRDDSHGCKWLDKDGYCALWYWHSKIKGWGMKSDIVNGERVYRLKVKSHPLMCTSCPNYKPRGLSIVSPFSYKFWN